MEHGLRVKNNNAEIQIDGAYSNYVFSEGSDNQNIGGTGGIKTHTFSNPTSKPPIVIFRPRTSIACGLISLNYSSPNYTGFIMAGQANAAYDYRVFVLKDTMSSEQYGMKIKNASGSLVFDSGYVPFRIVNVINTSNGATIAHGAVNPYYILTPLHCGYYCTWPGPPAPPMPVIRLIQGILKASDTQFTVNLYGDGYITVAPAIGGATTGSNIKVVVCEYDS